MGQAHHASPTGHRLRPIRTRRQATRPPVRVDRLPAFIGLAVDARAALSALKVLVAGVGSVGARIALQLARCEVGGLGLADPKPFSANFQTQAIRSVSDIGSSKAVTVGEWAKEISPRTTVSVFDGAVQTLPWLAIDDYDIVVASTDNLRAEAEIGQRCLWLGKPLVYAAVHGPTLLAQVQVFGNAGDDSPCPACRFGAGERDQLNGEAKFSCDPGDLQQDVLTPPTISCSPLCSLAADLAALTVLRLVLKLGPSPENSLMQFNTYRSDTMVTGLTSSPTCPNDHVVLGRATVDGPLRQRSLRQCAAAAGVADDARLADASFAVDDSAFARTLACGRCGHRQPHNRFVDPGSVSRCPACGRRALGPHQFFTFERLIPVRQGGLLAHLDTPLGDLGALGSGVVVRQADRAVLVRSTGGSP